MSFTVLPPFAVAGVDGKAGGPGGTPWNANVSTVSSTGGSLSRLTIAAPPAGSEWSYVVPTGTWIRILSGLTTFTASATVINRNVGIKILDPSSVSLGEWQNTGSIAAGLVQSVGYSQASTTSSFGQAGDTQRTAGLSQYGIVLFPGYTFRSATTNIQVGDQYGQIELFVELFSVQPVLDPLGPMIS